MGDCAVDQNDDGIDDTTDASPDDDRSRSYEMTNAAWNETDDEDSGRYRVLRYQENGSDLTVIQDRRNDDAWIQTDAAVEVRE